MNHLLAKKLQGFQFIAREKLQSILLSIPCKKDFIIEPTLIKPLELICVASWIKSKGVQRIFKFDPETAIPRQINTQVFLISSNCFMFKKVLNHIHNHESNRASEVESGVKNFHIIFVPNCSQHFHAILEEEGLQGIVELHRFNWDFISLDSGILSLELPQLFQEIFLRKDTSALLSVASSLRVLDMITGKSEIVLTYGNHSSKIYELLNRFGSPKSKEISKFSTTIIVDRNKDYPSCLLTPAIYSGLLLEVFKHFSGEIEINGDVSNIPEQKLDIFKVLKKTEKGAIKRSSVRLNSDIDEIYGDNRYKHFSSASNLVRAQAKALGVEVRNVNKMRLSEMQDYVVRKLPRITLMKAKILKHLNICEEIIDELAGNFQKLQSLEEDILNNTNRKKVIIEINEMLAIEGQKFNTIRLLCLVHLAMGLTTEELSSFICNYCNYFGYRYVYIFHNLANAGLLPQLAVEKVGKVKILSNIPIAKFQQTEFQANANRLKLLITDSKVYKDNDPIDCPSYVFNGLYIPLIAQLAWTVLKGESFDELVNKFVGIDNIEMHLQSNPELKTLKEIQAAVKRGECKDKFPLKARTIFIFVVGGITCAEIAACNLVGKLTGSNIIVGSNFVMSGGDVISAAF